MSITNKFSNTRSISIRELLHQARALKVPRFQRHYDWSKEKCTALWEDITENFDLVRNRANQSLDAQYLLGPIVLLSKKDNEFFVIDGQQRLATLTLLFCAARDIMFEHKEVTGIEKINSLIKNESMGSNLGWKLELNATDKDLFKKIQEYEPSERSQVDILKDTKYKTKSNKLLSGNYTLLHKKILEFLDDCDFGDSSNMTSTDSHDNAVWEKRRKNIPYLNYFLDFVVEYNYAVIVVVDDNNTAYQIFETLNERGQTLTKSDLIKNYVLNKVNKENKTLQTELSDKWDKIFSDITGQDQRDDDFIMESLRSRYFNTKLKISIKNLYKIVQIQFTDEKACVRFVKELEEDASFITSLNEPLLYQDETTRDEIFAMKSFDAKFIRIPILAAYRKWGVNSDYQKLVGLLVKFFFKFRVIRQNHPGKVEKLFVNQITRMIYDGEPLDQIIKVVLENDDHDDFLYKFSKEFCPSPETKVARYVLQQITINMGTEHTDVRPIDNLTLEHVLPQKHSQYWPNFLGKQEGNTSEFVSRLGNLTLLHSVINTELRNKSFLEKRNAVDKNGKPIGYNASELKINKDTVCNEDEWTPQIIEKREKLFKERVSNIWNLDSYKISSK